jgi:hypothetical protein
MELRCVNCGAALERPPFGTSMHCHFCGTEQILTPPPPPPASAHVAPLYVPSDEVPDSLSSDRLPAASKPDPVRILLAVLGLAALVTALIVWQAVKG